jgi:hypothetical protein
MSLWWTVSDAVWSFVQLDEDSVGRFVVDDLCRTLLERSWRIDGEHISESVLAGHYFGSGLTVMFVRRMAATPAATLRIGRPRSRSPFSWLLRP